MKNYISKSIFSALTIFGFSFFTTAQSPSTNEALGNIALTSYVPEQIENLPSGAENLLINKLNQITSTNGIAASGIDSRFIITANINVLTKDMLATAPPMTALTLDVTFYIGDGLDGKKYSSQTVSVKGVGTNENLAYMEAIKGINVNDESIQNFLSNGKKKIINYYNTRCAQIIKEAQALQAQLKYDEAIYKLTAIPEECTDCYNKAVAIIAPMFDKMINRDCKLKLAQANNLWAANQDVATANQVGEILNSIDPQAGCYNDVKTLSAKISKRVLDLEQREWDYKIETDVNLKRDLIKAYQAVGVAYGNGQAKSVVYNVQGWW
ncbi:hypothetical protein [Flavobacterium hydrophilum]|uniref:Uncharacterized protein n=1 Tax=Flavobacterium hydrophilum TaxID=2211445 RepID=A0A2V4C3D1_9FLAO|nr:hypothetical protein [Flavobacterium hydrophilum]PXY45477.1 hypothetical protein DMB68_12425 [Flavobacterium hydrophilum]